MSESASWRMGGYIELVAPLTDGSDVSGVLRRQGVGAYHICYETDDLADTIAEMKKRKWLVLKTPETAPAIGNRKVAVLYKASSGMIELVEE